MGGVLQKGESGLNESPIADLRSPIVPRTGIPRIGNPLSLAKACCAFVLLAQCCARGQDARIGVRLTQGNLVKVSVWSQANLALEGIELFRSTARLDTSPDTIDLPVTVLRYPGEAAREELLDSMVAHNTTYHYRALLYLKDGGRRWTGQDSVRTRDTVLGNITGSSILVDKLNYVLEVRDGGRMKKRYPVALGPGPRERKLHKDYATTPEGLYRIELAQPRLNTYRGYDLDYPNEIDSVRYDFAKQSGLLQASGGTYPGKGGEIQIHGGGIWRNWTNGCIALRNPDMDELFAHDRIGEGVPVFIVGTELSRGDISSIRDYRTPAEIRTIQRKLAGLGFYTRRPDGVVGKETRFALGRFQKANGLPVTCDLDRRTVSALSETE